MFKWTDQEWDDEKWARFPTSKVGIGPRRYSIMFGRKVSGSIPDLVKETNVDKYNEIVENLGIDVRKTLDEITMDAENPEILWQLQKHFRLLLQKDPTSRSAPYYMVAYLTNVSNRVLKKKFACCLIDVLSKDGWEPIEVHRQVGDKDQESLGYIVYGVKSWTVDALNETPFNLDRRKNQMKRSDSMAPWEKDEMGSGYQVILKYQLQQMSGLARKLSLKNFETKQQRQQQQATAATTSSGLRYGEAPPLDGECAADQPSTLTKLPTVRTLNMNKMATTKKSPLKRRGEEYVEDCVLIAAAEAAEATASTSNLLMSPKASPAAAKKAKNCSTDDRWLQSIKRSCKVDDKKLIEAATATSKGDVNFKNFTKKLYCHEEIPDPREDVDIVDDVTFDDYSQRRDYDEQVEDAAFMRYTNAKDMPLVLLNGNSEDEEDYEDGDLSVAKKIQKIF